MPTITVTVTGALPKLYQKRGYPKGKSIRGYKKWAKAFIIKTLTERAEEVLTNAKI